MIIEQNCTTCELHTDDCIGASDPCSRWISSLAALEAEVERLTKERHDALAQAAARDEEIATLHAQAEDWAAQYRALSASVEAERAGLRHSLAEVEDERDEAVSAMAEWRARAEVAEPERERLRDGLEKALEFIGRCRWDEEGDIPSRDLEMIEGLRALLGEAKEGGGA